MAAKSILLPTVISTAAILNAVVRGSEKAAAELGSDYFSVIHRDFMTPVITVQKIVHQVTKDVLAPSQAPVSPEAPLWSMKLTESDMSKAPFLQAIPAKHFFLTSDEALKYIGSIETAVINHVLAAAKPDKES